MSSGSVKSACLVAPHAHTDTNTGKRHSQTHTSTGEFAHRPRPHIQLLLSEQLLAPWHDHSLLLHLGLVLVVIVDHRH